VILGALAVLLVTFGKAWALDPYETTTDHKKIAWMQKGMELVKARLKDPDSAKFKGVYFVRGKAGVPVTCGQVNSRNSFGGYTGFVPFLSAGRAEFTFFPDDVDDWPTLWGTFCEG
jgi:hypothetical protein